MLLYRKIGSIGKITVALWLGVLLTTAVVIFGGLGHFDPKIAFDFPPNAFALSHKSFVALGAAASIGIYDYLGYYDVCYLGDEAKNPGKVIPCSILISLLVVRGRCTSPWNFSIIGVVLAICGHRSQCRRPAHRLDVHPENLRFQGAIIFTVMVLWRCACVRVCALAPGIRAFLWRPRMMADFSASRQTASEKNFRLSLLLLIGALLHRQQFSVLANRDFGADHYANPRAIRWPDRGRHAPAPTQAR